MEKYIIVRRDSDTNGDLVICGTSDTLRGAVAAEWAFKREVSSQEKTWIYEAIDWVPSEVEGDRND